MELSERNGEEDAKTATELTDKFYCVHNYSHVVALNFISFEFKGMHHVLG